MSHYGGDYYLVVCVHVFAVVVGFFCMFACFCFLVFCLLFFFSLYVSFLGVKAPHLYRWHTLQYNAVLYIF